MFTAADTPLPPPGQVPQSLSLAHVEARSPAEAHGHVAGPGPAPGAQAVGARGVTPDSWLPRPQDHLLLGESALV